MQCWSKLGGVAFDRACCNIISSCTCCVQPFLVLGHQGSKAAIILQDTNISTSMALNGICRAPTKPSSTVHGTSKHTAVALRLQDRTRALMMNAHFVDCVVEKSKGAAAYLVHRASSFVPEVQEVATAERVVWALHDVYAPLNTLLR